MANSNVPNGLTPVGYLSGAAWNGQIRTYCIPTSDTTNTYAIGDPVVLAGSADANGVPTVTLITPGSGVTGVIVGIAGSVYGSGFVTPQSLELRVLPATKSRNYYVAVVDDPAVLFKVQEVATGTALAAADISLNSNLVAGANNGFVSGWQLTNTTKATTATLDVQLMGLSQEMNNAFGLNAKHIVRINNHTYRAGTAGQ